MVFCKIFQRNFYGITLGLSFVVDLSHLWLIYPLKLVIFHSDVELPDGNYQLPINLGS